MDRSEKAEKRSGTYKRGDSRTLRDSGKYGQQDLLRCNEESPLCDPARDRAGAYDKGKDSVYL